MHGFRFDTSIALIALFAACNGDSEGDQYSAPQQAAHDETSTVAGSGAQAGTTGGSATGPMPEHAVPPDRALLERICREATCAGEFSYVIVYRDKDDVPVVYAHFGDLRRCSHPPATYFDKDFKQVLVQAERPVRDAEDAKQFQDERDVVLSELVEGEEIRCWAVLDPLP
jgi:hypothetical protein